MTNHTPARRTVVLGAGLAAAGLLLAVPGAATAAGPATSTSPATTTAGPWLRLPAPTGSERVGVRSHFVADPTRVEPVTGGPRILPVRVWYPARVGAPRPTARYLSAAVQLLIEAELDLPGGTFDVDTHAAAGVPVRSQPRGVVLVSAGRGMLAAFQTAQVIDLVSRGWAVVTLDHPHDTFVVEQPGGRLIERDLDDRDAEFAARVQDVGVVLRQLPSLVPGWRQGMPVGMFGHSLGGAAAAQALLQYPNLRAGVDLDGTPSGTVVAEGLDEPFGIMLSNTREEDLPPGEADVDLATFVSHLRGPRPLVHLSEIGHNGYTDFVVFNPQLALVEPTLGAHLESVFDTDAATPAAGAAALGLQRRFLADFMRRYVHQ